MNVKVDRPSRADSTFCLDRPLLFDKCPHEYLIGTCGTGRLWGTSEVGAKVFRLCDGSKTVDQIAQFICEKFEIDLDCTRRDVLELVSQFRGLGLLRSGKSSVRDDHVRPSHLPAPSDWRPLDVMLHVTNRCNLRCKHCYARSSPHEVTCELPTSRIKTVLDELASLGTRVIGITGGEPLARPDIMEILAYAKRKGFRVGILTNGTLVDGRLAGRISAHKIDWVQVSLDGSCREVHERLRGKNSYQRAIEGIQLLLRFDVRVVASMTLTKLNIGDLRAALTSVRRIGIPDLHLICAQNKGRAKGNNLTLSEAEMLRVIDMVFEIANEASPKVDAVEYFKSTVRKPKTFSCGAGRHFLSISSDGGAYPCPMLHEPAFLAGNVAQEELASIWSKSVVFRRFRMMDVEHLSTCSNCDLRILCGGGCRARAYLTTGSLYASDPMCAYIKQGIKLGMWNSICARTGQYNPTGEVSDAETSQDIKDMFV